MARILVISKISLCSVISFKRSRRELFIHVDKHRSMLKNYTNTHFPRFSFIPKRCIAFQKQGFCFYCAYVRVLFLQVGQKFTNVPTSKPIFLQSSKHSSSSSRSSFSSISLSSSPFSTRIQPLLLRRLCGSRASAVLTVRRLLPARECRPSAGVLRHRHLPSRGGCRPCPPLPSPQARCHGTLSGPHYCTRSSGSAHSRQE